MTKIVKTVVIEVKLDSEIFSTDAQLINFIEDVVLDAVVDRMDISDLVIEDIRIVRNE